MSYCLQSLRSNIPFSQERKRNNSSGETFSFSFSNNFQHNDIVMMDLEIKFQQTPASSFLVFFASNTWNTVVLDWQKKSSKLMLSLSAPAGRVSYSIDSDFDVDLSQVDQVTASCIRTCVVDVDLECLAGEFVSISYIYIHPGFIINVYGINT